MKKRINLLFVPQKANFYRPLLVRRYGLLVVLVIAFGVQLGYNYTHTGSVLGRVTTVTPAGLLISTNDERLEEGLSPLRLNAQLSDAAAAKARDMISHGYWDHVSPDGVEPWEWIDGAGYQYEVAGENLAKNFTTAGATVAAWMNSDPHRDNLLNNDYQDVGFATVYGELEGSPATVTVAMYGLPVSSQAVAGASHSRRVQVPPATASLTPAARIGVALQSLTPAAMTSLALLFVALTVAVTAHFYRSKLPRNRRESWYKHHGVVKASGLLSMAAFIVMIYGGGQI